MQELLQKAISIAHNSHKNQYNVNGEPYILHPMRIMLKTKNEEQMITAVLHDVVEKSDVELDHLEIEGFNKDIVAAVDALSRKNDELYDSYISRVLKNKLAIKIKVIDLMDNIKIHKSIDIKENGSIKLIQYENALSRIKDK